jgi:hypothetical protein
MTDRQVVLTLLLLIALALAGLVTPAPAREARCGGLTVLPACAEALRR